MSELIAIHDKRTIFHTQLLATVSSFALVTYVASTSFVHAEDTDRPQLWIELGGDAVVVDGQGQPFTAPFMDVYKDSRAFDPLSPVEAQKTSRYAFGEFGKLTFQPSDTDWKFSVAFRYGRSSNRKHVHQQTGLPIPTTNVLYTYYHLTQLTGEQTYADIQTKHSESHVVVDFQVGKDVGLGMFGKGVASDIDIGVRMARFDTRATVDMKVRPKVGLFGFYSVQKYWPNYALQGSSSRSFHGIGPSVSWNGSMPLMGNLSEGEVAFDWGVNAAVLFGRQKAQTHHNTTAKSFHSKYYNPPYLLEYRNRPPSANRSRFVTVPNLGGLAGISYRFDAAKLSIGYRADMFFNAMDTGIDARQTSNVLFHGPYASISIGLGG